MLYSDSRWRSLPPLTVGEFLLRCGLLASVSQTAIGWYQHPGDDERSLHSFTSGDYGGVHEERWVISTKIRLATIEELPVALRNLSGHREARSVSRRFSIGRQNRSRDLLYDASKGLHEL